MSECPPHLLSVHEPVLFSTAHALAWQEINKALGPLMVSKGLLCKNDFCVLAFATATVLTLHPAEERLASVEQNSHRRIGLAAQFVAAKLAVIGLQETRMKVARAVGIALYFFFSRFLQILGGRVVWSCGSFSHGYRTPRQF